jgi:hypothetical protein
MIGVSAWVADVTGKSGCVLPGGKCPRHGDVRIRTRRRGAMLPPILLAFVVCLRKSRVDQLPDDAAGGLRVDCSGYQLSFACDA